MYCPKCGKENPDDAQLCNLCKYTFGSRQDQDMPVEPKISRLAIFCLVLGISSLRRPPRSTQGVSSAASDVYKRQALNVHLLPVVEP